MALVEINGIIENTDSLSVAAVRFLKKQRKADKKTTVKKEVKNEKEKAD